MPGQPQIPNSTMLQQSQQQNSSDMNYATADEQPNLNSYNNSHNVSVSQAEYGGQPAYGGSLPAANGSGSGGASQPSMVSGLSGSQKQY